jgi:hypothetical protein
MRRSEEEQERRGENSRKRKSRRGREAAIGEELLTVQCLQHL